VEEPRVKKNGRQQAPVLALNQQDGLLSSKTEQHLSIDGEKTEGGDAQAKIDEGIDGE